MAQHVANCRTSESRVMYAITLFQQCAKRCNWQKSICLVRTSERVAHLIKFRESLKFHYWRWHIIVLFWYYKVLIPDMQLVRNCYRLTWEIRLSWRKLEKYICFDLSCFLTATNENSVECIPFSSFLNSDILVLDNSDFTRELVVFPDVPLLNA